MTQTDLTLKELQEQLDSCELDLARYKSNMDGDPALAANYMHKKAQVERLRALIAAGAVPGADGVRLEGGLNDG